MLTETLKSLVLTIVSPVLLKHVVGWKNYFLGEPEIRHLGGIVPPGRTSLDIGARHGAYAYFLSRLTPQVHCFEPDPEAADFCRRSNYSNVAVHEVALSDRQGVNELHVPVIDGREVPGQSSISAVNRGTASRIHRVTTCRLDDLDFRDIGFIKIDVEGHEEKVIAGAQALIARERPVLLVEIEARHIAKSVAEVVSAICALGYECRFLRSGEWRLFDEFVPQRDQAAGYADSGKSGYINNFLFLPAEPPARA